MFDQSDISRDAFMLKGALAKKGYDWWWHCFTGINDRTGEERQFFIEFYTINPALGGKEPVFGQLPANKEKGIKPSYLMVKCGCWGKEHVQLHRFFGWDGVTIYEGVPYEIKAGDCLASETHLRGSVVVKDSAEHPEWMCDDGQMSFDLSLEKKNTFNVGYGAGRLFRSLNAFEMYWHAEGMKTLFEGSVTLNGESYTVSKAGSYGYADKNWGSDFTSPWVWLASSDLVSENKGNRLNDSVFDIGGGRPKVFFFPLDRKLLGVMRYEGRQMEFNFAKFWQIVHTDFSFKEGSDYVYWHVRQENYRYVMETDIICKKEDMLFVNYEAPDGTRKHRHLFNGGNGTGIIHLYEKKGGKLIKIDVLKTGHVGCEYGEFV